MLLKVTLIEPRREKTCLLGLANDKGAEQSALPRRLISDFNLILIPRFTD